MARLPRLTLPGQLHHVLQRGNNRQPIFLDDADCQAMRDLLAQQVRAHAVALHAYVLMGNHFHLLATPSTPGGLARLMQALGRGHVQYFNRRHGRSGTLWEGRYRSTVLQAEQHLLPCMVYMDLNPVRAALVAQAGDYRWSSHLHWVGLRNDGWLTPHALYWALGNTPFAREAAYAALVQAGVDAGEQAALTASALSGWALGDAQFIAALQQLTQRRVAKSRPGRPRATAPKQQTK